jgi:hypothetical protein
MERMMPDHAVVTGNSDDEGSLAHGAKTSHGAAENGKARSALGRIAAKAGVICD